MSVVVASMDASVLAVVPVAVLSSEPALYEVVFFSLPVTAPVIFGRDWLSTPLPPGGVEYWNHAPWL